MNNPENKRLNAEEKQLNSEDNHNLYDDDKQLNAVGQALMSFHRREIDRIDEAIVGLLEQRMQHCRLVGLLKAGADRPLRQDDRFARVLEHVCSSAVTIPPETIKELYDVIHTESLRQQQLKNQ